tara:strand:+ start:107 stop:700 length:594 start_codon:yes stop_codon:yes gene_type:complete
MYYPKNRIKTGLQSNGDLVVKSTNEVYIGEYFETYDNKFYAGSNPNFSNLLELVSRSEDIVENGYTIPDWDEEIKDPRYNNPNYKPRNQSPQYIQPIAKSPKPYTKVITYEESKSGTCIRYYTKKSNEYLYFPISPEDFIKIKNQDSSINFPSYTCLSMVWNIVGGNEDNAAIIEEKYQWYGFTDYIKTSGNSLFIV